MRSIPQPLYGQVFDLATEITAASESDDPVAAVAALARLRALYDALEATGSSDPFVTETLADFTDDAEAAAELYRRAIEQAAVCPGEAVYSKQLGLASRLIDLVEPAAARNLLIRARNDAMSCGDVDAVRYADELLAGVGLTTVGADRER